jgi:endo-1,4-beta-D-glucanase Y
MNLKKPWLPILCLLLISTVIGIGCRRSSWPLWNSYSARFIDSQGRVSDPNSDGHTTSESQAYAMFFALAGNDRPHFDRLLAWTEVNLAQGDLMMHLPAWYWAKSSDGKWKVQDPNSASEADVWMAYSLLEAGRLWKDQRYSNIGRKMLAQISQTEVANLPGFGFMLLPGPVGFQRNNTWTLNPSYVPVFIFDRLATEDPTGPWHQIAVDVPRLLEESARHGYAMDWVTYYPGDGFYPAPEQRPDLRAGTVSDGPGGGYDAIRVYLWAGLQGRASDKQARLVNAVSAMGGYLSNHDAPPAKVDDQGIPVAQAGPIGFSAAVLPYLRAFPGRSNIGAQQLIRMSLMKDESTGLYGKEISLYDQNLALFSTGFLDGRFEFGPSGELKVQWKRR